MKPSERIKQIMVRLAKENGGDFLDYKIGSIWEYLDEIYEEEQKTLEKPLTGKE